MRDPPTLQAKSASQYQQAWAAWLSSRAAGKHPDSMFAVTIGLNRAEYQKRLMAKSDIEVHSELGRFMGICLERVQRKFWNTKRLKDRMRFLTYECSDGGHPHLHGLIELPEYVLIQDVRREITCLCSKKSDLILTADIRIDRCFDPPGWIEYILKAGSGKGRWDAKSSLWKHTEPLVLH